MVVAPLYHEESKKGPRKSGSGKEGSKAEAVARQKSMVCLCLGCVGAALTAGTATQKLEKRGSGLFRRNAGTTKIVEGRRRCVSAVVGELTGDGR